MLRCALNAAISMDSGARQRMNYCWRMTDIIAVLMRPMSLAVVVLHPFAVNLLHFLPTPGLMEMKVSHSPDDINYVELTLNSQDFSLLPV